MIARACPVPRDAFLARYVDQGATYTDCFEVMHPGAVALPEFVEAFYTTWLFRLERLVLSVSQRRLIRDSDAAALASGAADSFAVWDVEDRGTTQVLLRDVSGHTLSYLAVAPKDGGVTRLLFGSVVVPAPGAALPGWVRLTIPLHRFYSKLLLRAAERKMRYG
ncbi:MAG: hypothetical protein AB8B60_06500 [Sulfitobacter sp.]